MIDNLLHAYNNTQYVGFNPNLVVEIGVMNNRLNGLNIQYNFPSKQGIV